ncbi:MAG: hypothetical protein NTY15_11060 [Planctomycetota bacterium]|nr:hypothetical protein [Planctomycetota bacterium]
MTSESDMRAAGAFAAEDFAAEDFDCAFFGVAAFDADVLLAAGFEASAAGCADAFFTGFFVVFFVGIWFSQTTGFKTYTVLPQSG